MLPNIMWSSVVRFCSGPFISRLCTALLPYRLLTCVLVGLSKLPKLRKLSIFTSLREFPDQEDLEAFQLFRVLTKLKIEWGGLWGPKKEDNNQVQKDDADCPQIAAELQNLESESFPKKTAPNFLNPLKLKYLEKLCGAEEEDNSQLQNNDAYCPQTAAELQKLESESFPKKTAPDFLNPLKLKYRENLCDAEEEDNSQLQNNDANWPQLPATLEKLELQRFPKKTTPRWLNPMKLKHLEKLYITGSQLCDLGGDIGGWNGPVNPWRVKVLRLRYMTGLVMHWKEVNKLFPDLIYLEKVDCPKLSFFPCDEAGVWINKDKVQKK